MGAASDNKSITVPALQADLSSPAAAGSESATGDPTPDSGPEEAGRPITTPVMITGIATIALAAGAGVTGAIYLERIS